VPVLVRVLVNAVALWVTTIVVPGVSIGATGGRGEQVLTFVVLGALFGLVNVLVRPVVKLLSLPLYVLTLGLFSIVVNALMLELTAWLSGFTPLTLTVDDFFWSAVLGALVVGVVAWLLALLVPERRHERA
jgi:putative membrane protein